MGGRGRKPERPDSVSVGAPGELQGLSRGAAAEIIIMVPESLFKIEIHYLFQAINTYYTPAPMFMQ